MATETCTDLERLRVTKANKLIEVALIETTARLSLRDQKLILAVISQLSPDDEDFKKYEISIPELVQLTGINNKNLYAEIDKTCTRLMSSVIRITEPDNPKGFLLVTWFSHASYLPDKGHVEFSISPELTPYLLQLKKNFTTYSIRQVINLQSTHSIRLYELLRQYLPLNSKQASTFREIVLDDLKKYLGIGNCYSKFADFRRYVLESAQSQLSEKTDIAFDFEPVRKGRRVGAVKFCIYRNRTRIADSPKAEDVSQGEYQEGAMVELDSLLIDNIRAIIPDIDDIELTLICRVYSHDLIAQSLIDFYSANASGAVRNPKSYLKGILKKKHQEEQLQNSQHSQQHHHQTTEEKLTDRSWAD